MFPHPLLSLLANFDSVRSISRYIDGPVTTRGLWVLLMAVIGMGILWVGIYFWEKLRVELEHSHRTPDSLFRDLCRTHHLSKSEQALLREAIADSQQIVQVFLNPAHLNLLAHARPDLTPQCHSLRVKLFGQLSS